MVTAIEKYDAMVTLGYASHPDGVELDKSGHLTSIKKKMSDRLSLKLLFFKGNFYSYEVVATEESSKQLNVGDMQVCHNEALMILDYIADTIQKVGKV